LVQASTRWRTTEPSANHGTRAWPAYAIAQAPGSFKADSATGSSDNHDVARQRRSIELAASDQTSPA